jgi:hypothetical protein
MQSVIVNIPTPWSKVLVFSFLGLATTACQPTVKIETPDKPIVINMNVKIEQEVRIKVEKDVENLLNDQSNEDIF